MNVFDFDGTIYDGDSSIDFWFFSFIKNPALIRFLPRQLSGAFLYKAGKISKEEFKSRYFSFFSGISNIDSYVEEFWNVNERKIKSWYKEKHRDDDCVISASPKFLLLEICERLVIKNLIATKVDKQTGKLLGKNCHDKNKPDFYREHFKEVEIEEFYSDSKSDIYLAKIAKQAFIVRENKIYEWKNPDRNMNKR